MKKVCNYGNFWFVFLLSNYIPIPLLIAAQDSDEEHASNRRAYDQQFDIPLDQAYNPQNISGDFHVGNTITDTSTSVEFVQESQLIGVQNDESASCINNGERPNFESNIPGSVPLVIVTNPAGAVAAVAVVAAVLVVDKLAQMGVINSGWSLEHIKENAFGVKIYDGDEYYKNWSNPKNLDRQFPTFIRYEGFLSQRFAYEREMSYWLIEASKVLKQQKALKQLDWPDRACDKILNFTLTADPIYISENEEFQLDDRLTCQLANCRDSALRRIKEGIAELYNIFESLGNELVYQLKNVLKDLLDFKLDPKILILLGVVAIDQLRSQDGDFDSQIQEPFDGDDCFFGMNKKNIVELFSNGSESLQLLDDFNAMLDLNEQFLMQYLPIESHFVWSGHGKSEKISVESMMAFLKHKIAIKKSLIQGCLDKIGDYCKKTNQLKLVPHVVKSLKKEAAHRLRRRNKKIEQRLRWSDSVTIDILKLLSFDRIFSDQPLLLDLMKEVQYFIDQK